MAIKLADTTRPNNYTNSENPGTFPVAYAENVWLNDGTDLESFLADFEGNGGVQKEELPLASATEEGNIYQYIGATGTYTNGYFYKCVEDSGSYSWVNIQVQDAGAETIIDVNSVPVSGISNVIYRTTDLSGDASYYAGNETASNTDQLAKYSDIQIIQVDTLPTASANELGNIYEFVGTTTANYINGRFYRCISDGASTPTYTWEEVDLGDGTPHWSGTRAEYEAIKDTLEAGTYVSITDDYDDGLEVVDVIEDGNMNPVTSNAVAGLFGKVNTISVTMRPDAVPSAAKTLSSNMFIPTSADGKRGLLIGRAATEPFTAPTSITNFDISSPAIALWHNWVISSAYEYSNANARLCYVDTNVPGFYMDGLTTTGSTLKAVQFIADVTLA